MGKSIALNLNVEMSVADLSVIGETEETGTTIRFKADPEIFTETTVYEFDILAHRCVSCLFKSWTIVLQLQMNVKGKKNQR